MPFCSRPLNLKGKEAPRLVAELPDADYIIADRGYDSEDLRIQIRNKGAIPIIPRKKNSIVGNDDIDWCLYKYRHLVENVFARLKHFRAIATRYDKLKHCLKGLLLWLVLFYGCQCETATASKTNQLYPVIYYLRETLIKVILY